MPDLNTGDISCLSLPSLPGPLPKREGMPDLNKGGISCLSLPPLPGPLPKREGIHNLALVVIHILVCPVSR